MNVLLLGSEDRPEENGGVGVACRGLAEALVRLGVGVCVVHPGATGDETRAGVRWIGVGVGIGDGEPGAPGPLPPIPSPHPPRGDGTGHAPVTRRAPEIHLSPYLTRTDLSQAPTSPRRARAPSSLLRAAERFARAVARATDTLPADLIHAHDWPTIPAAIRLARARACPLILHFHSTEYDRAPSRPDPALVALEHRGLALADRVVTVSRRAAATLLEHFGLDPRKLTVVHNAVDPRRWSRRAAPTDLRDRQPIVLFLARLTEQKDPLTFLEAAARVLTTRLDCRFVVAGDGPLRAALEARARALGIQAAVHFTGTLEPEDVERMFAIADLYVLPSVAEPFGLSALEAMCLDVPVLVARDCGVREVLPEALAFESGDADELADRILSVLSRPVLYRSLVARGGRRARSLRWEHRAQRLLALYRELLP